MAATYLDDILSAHRRRASRDTRIWQDRADSVRYEGPSFAQALVAKADPRIALIAEIKRRSPSKGWIDEHLDPGGLAHAYEEGGASAISVLTDEDHFSGSKEDVAVVRARVSIPVLRKDFTVSENDVLDAADMGASAVLLIVAALSDLELRTFLELAQRIGLDALVEVHDKQEARRALDQGARLVGVNQRDLRNFTVDKHRAASVVASLGTDVLKVAESGITSVEDVEGCAGEGFDAVLVGEALVRAPNPMQLVSQFASVTRVVRD